MRFAIDSEVCKRHNLSMHEVMYLQLMSDNVNIPNLRDALLTKMGIKDQWNNWRLLLNSDHKTVLSTILTESSSVVKQNINRFEELATKLQELYPKGKKDGTAFTWRDSKQIITRRLEKLVEKYGDCFTDEQAIEATRKYVESFNGNYQYMKLLKYFIWKNDIKTGVVEEESLLLSYIENAKELDTSNSFDNSFDELRV